jgi:hypothetical protein
VLVDQAIFTSMVRRGKAGYHVVSRSPGVTESEESALSTWSPSHGGLVVDGDNCASANFFPLPSGRYAIARTREGGSEYSGRGGRQLFTRAVIVDAAKLRSANYQPFAIYRDALALGHLAYMLNPEPTLRKVELSQVYTPREDDAFAPVIRELGMPVLEAIIAQLDAGRPVVECYTGDRTFLAEFLLARLSPETALVTSFATSLHPSSVRPFRLNLVAHK